MGRDRATYMREYRARRAIELRDAQNPIAMGKTISDIVGDLEAALDRIAELEEEVRHLKAELAKHHEVFGGSFQTPIGDRFNTRPFTPVPKK